MQIQPSARDDWRTPAWLIKAVQRTIPIKYDATAGKDGSNCLPNLLPMPYSSLDQPWGLDHVWANPPYDMTSLARFTDKFLRTEWTTGAGLMLVPAKADQQWFHDAWTYGRFLPVRGRVRFEGATGSPQFASGVFGFGLSLQESRRVYTAINTAQRGETWETGLVVP
jgi:hypothetical protein